jgi:spore coat protein U-like protein
MPAIRNSGELQMRMLTGVGILAGLACVGGPAVAGTTTLTFGVQLTIQAQCVINSTATLNFGTAGVLGGAGGATNTDGTTTVAVQCTDTTPFDIGLNAGTGTGASTTTRKMTKNAGTATVNYTLTQDAGRATNWGNQPGTDTMTLAGDGASHSYTIYGRIPPQTTPAPGNYADTVTVTVTY